MSSTVISSAVYLCTSGKTNKSSFGLISCKSRLASRSIYSSVAEAEFEPADEMQVAAVAEQLAEMQAAVAEQAAD